MESNTLKKIIKKIATKEELLDLLNTLKQEEAKSFGQDSYYPFVIKHINYYCNPNHSGRYCQFSIPKKNGGTRTIYSPNHTLKNILYYLNEIFNILYQPNNSAYGFVHGKSIVDNARKHQNNNYVFNIDLSDFFTSIDQARVWGRLQAKPYRLKKEMASIIAGLCSIKLEMPDNTVRFVLPQGAPTSPVLSNMICEKLDWLLSKLARKYKVVYSRYADDITFSSQHNVYQKDSDFRKELWAIIEGQRFKINPAKTRLIVSNYRQEVTGLIVNSKVNVTRRYVKNIRTILHIWEKYGLSEAQKNFLPYYLKEKSRNIKGIPHVENVVYGKLLFLKMVKGENDSTYQKLWSRYLKLIDQSVSPKPTDKRPVINEGIKSQKTHLHFPKDVVLFLNNFTKNGSALKYTTHPWDAGSYESFSSFFEQYNNQLQQDPFWTNAGGDKRLYNCDDQLYYIIRNFLLTENLGDKKQFWGKFRLKIGYKSPNGMMDSWLKEHPESMPAEMPLSILPKEYIPSDKVDGETLTNFGQVINKFKESIEFRGSNFHNMVRRVFTHPDIDLDKIETLKGYSIYTNTFKIELTIRLIRDNIISVSGNHKVKIWAKCNEDNTLLCIHILHLDSYSDANPNINKKLLLCNKGNMLDITENLKGLCNFYVKSRFRNDNEELITGIISYLYETEDGNPTPKITWQPDEVAEGFEYILMFYML